MTKSITSLEASIIQIARDENALSDVCELVEYDPDVGSVPEHWRVQWPVLMVARAIESAATAPLLERIAELEVKLAQQAGHGALIAEIDADIGALLKQVEAGEMPEFSERSARLSKLAAQAISIHPERVTSAMWQKLCETQAALLEIQARREETERRLGIAQQAEAQEPLFWYRPCADGLYEGPHHNNAVLGRMLREEKPYAWKPLFTRPQPAQLQRLSEEETMTAWRGVDDAGDDRRNAMLYGDAIQSAIAAKNGAALK